MMQYRIAILVKQRLQQVQVRSRIENYASQQLNSTFKNFVQSSSFLNSATKAKQNYQHQSNNYNNNNVINTQFNNTQLNYNIKPKGYDFYNKNNLLLKACYQQDIQYVRKNPVVFQQDIIVIPKKSSTLKNIPGQFFNNTNNSTKQFYKQRQKNIQEVKLSKQAQLNQFLFNYRKQEQEKKNKKLKFLSEVERKLNNLQKQAQQVSQEKKKQLQQIHGILKIQAETTNFSKRADLMGKLNNALYQINNENNSLYNKSPKKVTEDMELLEINAIIEDHHQCNDALLDQVERVSRSKSKQRIKFQRNNYMQNSPRKTGMKKIQPDQNPQSSLSKTLKRPMQIPPKPNSNGHKKLISTWRAKS